MFSVRHIQWSVRFIAAAAAVPLVWSVSAPTLSASESLCSDPRVIWCDDFEDTTAISSKYFDYNNDSGDFVRVTGQGMSGSAAMQVIWQPGEVDAGSILRTFGRNPIGSQSHTTQDFREIFWRIYVRMAAGWSGNSGKLTRAESFASSSWAQAMAAHVWGDGTGEALALDAASGVVNNQLVTTTFNDFAHLQWIGFQRGTYPFFNSSNAERWICVESHVKLNTPGSSDGVFETWIDGVQDARETGLNWVGTYQTYAINGVSFENYWNPAPTATRMRYFDNIVISTGRIGCLSGGGALPSAPTNLRIVP